MQQKRSQERAKEREEAKEYANKKRVKAAPGVDI